MAIVLYGIPNCDQVKKARMWLDNYAEPYVFHDFKKAGLNRTQLDAWLGDVDWNILVNRKSTTWRSLSDERKASINNPASAIELMLEIPSVIKRPILNKDEKIYVGFTEQAYQQIFKK